MKLKVFNVDKEFFYTSDRNLDDGSYVPKLNLEVTAENTLDYSLILEDENIFIPESTKFTGHISEIDPPKKFNKNGYFKVTFDKAICPDGTEINLKSSLTSKSEHKVYSPLQHLGKTALSLVGGSLAGALVTLNLGGLGLAAATHGYSLAVGAGAGGFLGTVGGVVSSGKKARIEPGSELTMVPVDDVSLEQLKQVTCKKSEPKEKEEVVKNDKNEKVDLKILSVKKNKYALGEAMLKINIRITNNSKDIYRLNNFFLLDSQGKEYTTSIVDVDEDIFKDFPPKITKTANLEFFVDHPKASHWLVLKDRNFSEEIGKWKIVAE
ncbi:MAG: hypothetical protein HY094_09685 [Candidatus Melainabacteria bacterium]|nr:hypothetical protein [Candidatus Melainabacteria bacterium]